MIKQVLPLISEIDAENVEKFKELDTPLLIACIDPTDSTTLGPFLEVAESPLHDSFLFGTTIYESLFQMEPMDRPYIVLWNPLDEVPAIYQGEFEVGSITKFAEGAVASPLIPQFGMQKFAEYAQVNPFSLLSVVSPH